MKNKGIVKVVFVVVIFVTVLMCFSNIYAELSGTYSSNSSTTLTDGTVDTNVKNSKLLQAIGALVYFVGNAIVWLLSLMSSWFIGSDVFPWADMILYNAIPFLDINFIKPNDASLIFQLSGIIRNVYFSVLSIAIAFFSVAVLVMAIKLVSSTIASEKARYKEAVKSWVIGVILLFTLHYFISFIFYINETLVVLASTIAKDKLENFSLETANVETGIETMKNILSDNNSPEANYLNDYFSTEEGTQFLRSFVSITQKQNKDDANSIIDMLNFPAKFKDTNIFSKTFSEIIQYFVNDQKTIDALYNMLIDLRTSSSNDLGWINELKSAYKKAVVGISESSAFMKMSCGEFADNYGVTIGYSDDTGECDKELYDVYKKIMGEGDNSIFMNFINSTNINRNMMIEKVNAWRYVEYMDRVSLYYEIINAYRKANNIEAPSGETNGGTIATEPTPIGTLAEFFRTSALSVETGKLLATKVSFENSVMYTIFVAQSLLYFMAYIKRFFYVIILSIMGPIFVAFDFFKKATSK